MKDLYLEGSTGVLAVSSRSAKEGIPYEYSVGKDPSRMRRHERIRMEYERNTWLKDLTFKQLNEG